MQVGELTGYPRMRPKNGALQPGCDEFLHRSGYRVLEKRRIPVRFVDSVFIHFCIGGNQEIKRETKRKLNEKNDR